MGFNQQYQGPIQNVYNVEGNLVLSGNSAAPDLVRQLTTLQQEIASLKGLDTAAHKVIEGEVVAAEAEGRSADPDGDLIKTHLEKAAGILEGASGVAERGGKLVKTLVDVGKWAAATLA